MGPNRKAVSDGITRQQPSRSCKGSSANVAEFSDAGKSGTSKTTTTMATNARAKRTPRRSAKDKWDEEKLMTSSKSELVKLELVKLLARPEAWNELEQAEQHQILDLLPDHVHPHPYPGEDGKIPALPESFLRYSNHWRDGVRQFQVDLENGRYDPEWLRQAEQAVQERAEGAFDNFKEQEFEEFWGQKQKLDKSLAAGESSQIKLDTLIENGLVREGDIWKLSRGFGSPGARGRKVLVEKEAKIMELNGMVMTCIVPAGQRTFLPHVPDTDFQALLAAYKSNTDKGSGTAGLGKGVDVINSDENTNNTGPEKTEAVDLEDEPKANDAINEDAAQPLQTDVDEDQESESLRKRRSETSGEPRKKQRLGVPDGGNADDENLVQMEEAQPDHPESRVTRGRGRGRPRLNPDLKASKNGNGNVVSGLGSSGNQKPAKRGRGRPRKCPEKVPGQPNPIPGGQELPPEEAANFSVEVRNSQPTDKGEFFCVTIDNTTPPKPENSGDAAEPTANPASIDSATLAPVKQEQNEDKPTIDTNTRTVPKLAEQDVSQQQPSSFTLSPLTLGGVEVVILMQIHGATNLGNKMIEVDGRITHIPNGNAWKEFRCYRNNQDMGSLWEVRQAWYVKQK